MIPGSEGAAPAAPEPLQSDLLLQPIFGLAHIDAYVQALRAFAHERQAWVRGLLVRVTHIFLDTTLQVHNFAPVSTSVVPLMPQDIGLSVTHLARPCTNLSLPQELDDVLHRRQRVEKEVMSLAGHRLWPLMDRPA